MQARHHTIAFMALVPKSRVALASIAIASNSGRAGKTEETGVKKLMHYANKPENEQMVWLVWEMQADRPALAVICTTDEDLKRYVNDDRTMWRGRPSPVFCEKVMCDHLYGAHDSGIAMRLLRAMA